MAHIFKHIETDKLYTIEHLREDIRFLNSGAFEGIYAKPYKWKGESIIHTRQQLIDKKIQYFNPEKFISDNFAIVGEF